MAISAANLTSGENGSAGTTFTTASISPSADKLILLSFTVRNGASTDPTISSISGNGLTWVLVNSSNWDPDSSSRRTTFVYRSMGSSPSTGAITVTFGESNTNSAWSVDEFTNVDTSGTNGSGAVVQSAHNEGADPSSNLTVTLGAFSSANNATFGAFGEYNNATPTVDTGWTLLASKNTLDSIFTEFIATNDTSVYMAFSPASKLGGVGIEIAEAVASSTVRHTLTMLGVS